MTADQKFLALAMATFTALVIYPVAPRAAITLMIVLLAGLVLLSLPFRGD